MKLAVLEVWIVSSCLWSAYWRSSGEMFLELRYLWGVLRVVNRSLFTEARNMELMAVKGSICFFSRLVLSFMWLSIFVVFIFMNGGTLRCSVISGLLPFSCNLCPFSMLTELSSEWVWIQRRHWIWSHRFGTASVFRLVNGLLWNREDLFLF